MMDDAQLIRIIDQERSQGIGHDDTSAGDRVDAMAFYEGDAKGKLAPPEIEDRSTVVSKDVMEAVEWVMPSLMRMFCGTDDVVRFEPQAAGDEQACKDATEYCGYLLHRANPGFIILHDAIKSALIARMGVIKVYPDKTYVEIEESYQGLDQMQFQALSADKQVEIVEVAVVEAIEQSVLQGQPEPQPITYDVRVRRKRQQTKYVVEGVPPEEITFSKETRDIEKLRFVCHEVRRTKSDLLSLGYDADLVGMCFDDEDVNDYQDGFARADYDSVNPYDDNPADLSQRTVTLVEAFMRVDYDEDGIAEYRRIVKAGHVVFENDLADDHEFALFTPILMPYKLMGLSFYDLLRDLQVIKTEITRQMLDSMALSNNPRSVAVAGQVNLDDLLNARPNGVIRVKSLNAVQPFATQDISASAQNSLAYFNQVRDARSGVKEYTQGLIGGELSKSQIGSQGVSVLADAAAARIELIARVLAETGITRVYKLLLKLVSQYQDDAVEIKINGHWMTLDPRAWKNEYNMTVSVGVGTASQDKKLARASQLLNTQMQASEHGLVSPQNALNALTEFVEALGFRDVSQFFGLPQPQAPQPSPIEMQMQLEREKAQMQMQVEQNKQTAQAQEQQMQKQLEVARDERDSQNQMALAQFKAEQDMKLEQFKATLQQQTAIEIARINAEAKIASARVMGAKDTSAVGADMTYQEVNE